MVQEFDPKFKEVLRRRRMEGLLSGWYNDAAYAENEVVASCPSIRPLSELMDRWQKRRLAPAAAQSALVKEMWSEIAGPQLAIYTAFARIETDGTAVIEVRHPGFLRELSRPEKQAELLAGIQRAMGNDAAQKLRFIPANAASRKG